MNRRGFVAGMGALAAAGAAARVMVGNIGQLPVHGSFVANSKPLGSNTIERSSSLGAVTLGYIPGSAEFIISAIRDLPYGNTGAPVSPTGAQISIRNLVTTANSTLERLDIVADFDMAAPPYHTPFYAWQYLALAGQPTKASGPATFTGGINDTTGIAFKYLLRDAMSGEVSEGGMYYPIGGPGLGPGIYALAGPSRSSRAAPDFSQIILGEQVGALAHRDGLALDFDYVTLALRPSFGLTATRTSS